MKFDPLAYGLQVCGMLPSSIANLPPSKQGEGKMVADWQAAHGLAPDGKLGPGTADAMHFYAIAALPPPKVTPHFKAGELYSGTARDTAPPDAMLPDWRRMARNAEVLRLDLFGGVACEVVAGYRTQKFNELCGGEKNSYHLRAMAVDIRPAVDGSAGDPRHWQECVDDLIAAGKLEQGGVHCYLEKARPFVHYDFRGFKARW